MPRDTSQSGSRDPFLVGVVRIKPEGDLAAVSEIVGSALGVKLVEDKSGDYEEFPAYCGEALGIHVALLGPPAPEHDLDSVRDESLELQVQADDRLSALPGRIEVDISQHLLRLLQNRTQLRCFRE